MTLREAQDLLNEMLYPFSKEEKCIEANGTLSAREKNYLLQIVIDFENLSGNYNYNGEQIKKS